MYLWPKASCIWLPETFVGPTLCSETVRATQERRRRAIMREGLYAVAPSRRDLDRKPYLLMVLQRSPEFGLLCGACVL